MICVCLDSGFVCVVNNLMIVQCFFLMISSMLLLTDISMLRELHDLQNDTAIDSVDIIAWYSVINTRRFCNVLCRYESDDIHRTILLLFTACSDISLLTELSKISEIWRVLQCPPPMKVKPNMPCTYHTVTTSC
jgi:hypothetical protein